MYVCLKATAATVLCKRRDAGIIWGRKILFWALSFGSASITHAYHHNSVGTNKSHVSAAVKRTNCSGYINGITLVKWLMRLRFFDSGKKVHCGFTWSTWANSAAWFVWCLPVTMVLRWPNKGNIWSVSILKTVSPFIYRCRLG